MNDITLSSIAGSLTWENQPANHQVKGGEVLTITAGKQTDLFTDPQGTSVTNNSPRLLFPADDTFIFSAKVTVEFNDVFDAGVLILYASEEQWAKLCFEFTPERVPAVVSVVTHGLSDDCNSILIDGNTIYLRISRLGQAFAFHYSLDGTRWHLIRYFSLGKPDQLRVGFSVQAPKGDSCTATFSEISYAQRTLGDVRSGE